MSDLFSKTNSIRCHLKQHADLGLGISVMCLDEKCLSNKKAICAICAKESHVNHKVISITKIEQCLSDYHDRWINNRLKNQLVSDFEGIITQIEQCYVQYGQTFQQILDEITLISQLYNTYLQNETLSEADLQKFGVELMAITRLEGGSLSLKCSGQKQLLQLKQIVFELQSLLIVLNKALKQNDFLQNIVQSQPEREQLKQYIDQLEKIQDQQIMHTQIVNEDSFSLCDKNLIKLKSEYFSSVTAVDVTMDGSMMAGASNWSNKVLIYDLDSMTEIKCLLCPNDRIQALKFSPNKRYLAIGSGKVGDIWLWDVNNLDLKPQILKGHTESLNRFAFQQDSKLLCSVGGDRKAIVWNIEINKSIFTMQGHAQAINGCSFGKENISVATISDDKHVIIHKNGEIQKRWQAHSDEGYCVEYSFDFEWILTSGKDKIIKLWSGRTYSLLQQYEGHQRGIWTCGFSPFGQYIASASWDDSVRIWNTNNNNDVVQVDNQFMNLPQVSISGFGKCIVSCSKKGFNVWRR